MFYRTNASQGWRNFGETLNSAQRKRFNAMKSGMGSSLSGASAETRMMRAVCENKEIMDEYHQMQARLKKLNKDKTDALNRINQLQSRQKYQIELNNEKDMRYTTMTNHRQEQHETEISNRKLFNERRHSDFNNMQKSRYDLRGRNRSNANNIKFQ